MKPPNVELLHQAIDLAQGYAEGQYRNPDGTPKCIVAQYVKLTGGYVRDLEEGRTINHPEHAYLGLDWLSPFQELWDGTIGPAKTEEKVRVVLHRMADQLEGAHVTPSGLVMA